MVDKLDTQEFLHAIYCTDSYKQLLADQLYSYEEYQQLVYPSRTILANACVVHHERQFLGYYFVDEDRRELWGMRPISYLEFCLFCFNIAYILFYKPTLNVAIWYTQTTFKTYGLPVEKADEFCLALQKIYESRTPIKTD